MIKQRPAYESSDGGCHKTYEEAQKAELGVLLFNEEPKIWTTDHIGDIIKHANEIREILKPAIGRPTGSRNGSGRRRTSRVVAAENAALQDGKQ